MKLRYILFHILMCLALAFVVPSCVDPVEDPDEIVDEEGEDGGYDGDVLYEEALDNICEFVNDLYLESSTLKELADHSKSIKKIKGVAKVYTSDIALFVETVHGAKLSWTYFPVPEVRSSDDYQVTLITEEGLETKSEVSLYEIVPEYEDVCIIFQMRDDERYEDLLSEYEELADRLEDCGAYVDMVYDFDIEFLQESITEYDVVILATRGFYEKDINGEYKHWIMLSEDGEDYVYEMEDDVSSDVICGYVKEYWSGEADYWGYLMVSEDFLEENIKGSFDETSLIFNTAGESLKDNDAMASAFSSKGAGVYIGYKDSQIDYQSEFFFFDEVMQTASISEAVLNSTSMKALGKDGVRLFGFVIDEGNMLNYYDKTIGELFMTSETINDLSSHLDYIKDLEGVERAYISDFTLFVETSSGLKMSWAYFPVPQGLDISSAVVTKDGVQPKGTLSLFEFKPEYQKVCIAYQMIYDDRYESLYNEYYELAGRMREMGADVDIVISSEFGVDFIQNHITEYDVLILASYGFYAEDINGEYKHWLMLGEKFEDYFAEYEYDDATIMRTSIKEVSSSGTYMHSYTMVSEDFLAEHIKGTFDDTSLIFNASGESLRGDVGFSDVFHSKGAGVYVGYEGTVCSWMEEQIFWNEMLGGNDLQNSLKNVEKFRNDTEINGYTAITAKKEMTPEFRAEYTESVENQITPFFMESEDIDELSKYINEISAVEGVAEVRMGDNFMTVEIKEGETLTWFYPIYPMGDEIYEASISQQSVENGSEYSVLTKEKFCFIYQISNDEYYKNVVNDYDSINSYFSTSGFLGYNSLHRTRIYGSSFNLSFIKNDMMNYDFIFIATHGRYDKGLHWITTGQPYHWMDIVDGKVEHAIQKEIRNGKKEDIHYLQVSEQFIRSEDVKGGYNNSIVINTACHSLEGNYNMADAFKSKGAGAYVGYDSSNCKWYIGKEILARMRDGMSLGEAINDLPQKYKRDEHTIEEYLAAKDPVVHAANLKSAIPEGDAMYLVKPAPTPGQWVDLGLSVEWAGWNVDANSPEEYGGYYAWGETETKDNNDYIFDEYKHIEHGGCYICEGENCESRVYKFIGEEISGTSDDVAHIKWGGGARMPTRNEAIELVQNCTFKKGSYNGVKGVYVLGPNGKCIFIPFAGVMYDGKFSHEGYSGDCWTGTCTFYYPSTICEDCSCAYALEVSAGLFDCSDYGSYRHYGKSVRPVRDK